MSFAKLGQVRGAAQAGNNRRQQVAAVCFRILSTGIEFLLVRTRRNRWTFPKGGVEPGLTCAQSAAIEAYEEAGVHGRIEEVAFAQYTNGKLKSGGRGQVHAHLCEVLSLGEPEEWGRNPTWFSAAKAKSRLAEARNAQAATELSRVVDRAAARIRRFPGRAMVGGDPLMRVQFEAEALGRTVDRQAHRRTKLDAPSAYSAQLRQQNRGKIIELRPTQPGRM